VIFLIEYDRRAGQIVRRQDFEDRQRLRAEDARLEIELTLNRQGIDHHEVVLLEATSEEVVHRTHRRYFESLSDLAKSTGDGAA
jgi:hypothetical protein